MKKMVLIISIISCSIFAIELQLPKLSQSLKKLNKDFNQIHSTNLEECNDPDACNYDPTAENDDGCIYMATNECDCDGNYFDCSGVCGGTDFESCTIMFSEAFGIYQNEDCSGEFFSQLENYCAFYPPYQNEIYLYEEDCNEAGGAWLNTETCYTNTFEIQSPDECIYNNGIIIAEIDGCSLNEQPTIEECEAAGGLFNAATEECIVMDENTCQSLDGIWGNMASCLLYIVEPAQSESECHEYQGDWASEDLIPGGDSPPHLYFYDDGYFGTDCNYDCILENDLSQEECESAGANYDIWDEECEVDSENSCVFLNGTWFEGVCPNGTYTVDNTVIITESFDGDEIEDEFIGELEYDEYGNWDSIEFTLEYFFGICLAMKYNSTITDLSITDLDMTLPLELTLNNVYPNPFNPITNISFDLDTPAFMEVKIVNILGEEIDKLILGQLSSGKYNFNWDASNHPSGVYFIQLIKIDGNGVQASAKVQKAILMK